MLLTPRDVHTFLGYSFHFGQYWQYKSSERGTIWSSRQRLSISTLGQYKPLGLILSTLCDTTANGHAHAGADAGGSGGRRLRSAKRLRGLQQGPPGTRGMGRASHRALGQRHSCTHNPEAQ